MPLVSVLIPTYNYAQFIEEAITSVLSQTFQDFEVIIVDDNSCDNTDQVVSQYIDNEKVFYFKNRVNLGLVGNFNKCLEHASGKYIKYLLADDKLHPTVLQKMVPVMERNPRISLITSYSQMFGIKTKIRILPFTGLITGKKAIFEALNAGKGNWIGEPSVVMFRKLDLKVGNFDNKYTCLVDLEMWLRLLMIGDCYILPEPLASFRHHPKQASSKTNLQNWIDEYEFYRDVKLYNPYNFKEYELAGLNLDLVIKDRAVHCAKGMIRILHKSGNKKTRLLIRKAFSIALREKVVLNGFFAHVRKQMFNQ